ncbi:MAG: tRNA (guanosine(46)-N7)-methyltransferase TrmB [Ectothiorhodospiraceae bacterium]|nr:tRNA (guanosine(46)-N7)-methyltransferase TrmB [Ectothiorhodospiraceae bacterium]
MSDATPAHHRAIRSFVRREGRLTEAQRRALDELQARWGVPFSERTLAFAALFGREAPVVMEIGFGNGESLAEMAAADPERNYLGVEVHRPGVGRLLNLVEQQGLRNVRVICHDAVEVLRGQIPDASLAGVQLYFPDPWPKKRHHKRRIVQPAWVELVADKLKAGGELHMATDWESYAQHMLEVLEACPAFENTAGPGNYSPHRGRRPQTKFERRGLRKGHGVWDLIYRKRGDT